ncbi:MAG: cyclopropane-fatty-acyl-phospholipid synthase family protein [Burkholderiales bacterium]
MSTREAWLQHSEVALPRTARIVFALLSRLQNGALEVIAPEGQTFSFHGALPGPHAVWKIADWRVCDEILRSGDVGFAEGYLDGRWNTPDLAALLELAAVNRAVIERALYGHWLGRFAYRLRHLLRPNTRAGARRNIHAHYDLGNDFYRAWLDGSMTYSSAVFGGDKYMPLELAQDAKYDRILDQLQVRPGDRILEIGCGWGGFAERAARSRGAQVHGITISREQHTFARQRIRSAGLESLVDIELCDYRDVRGSYDHVVSIEMFEAVGESYWPEFFRTVRERLEKTGRAVIQTIVIADDLFEQYRRSTDFIQQYVFPGGMLPSTRAFFGQAQRAGLRVRETLAFGGDYAETVRRWRERYNQAAAGLRGNGFDARFERLWNFYLAYCEAGFRAGSIDVKHMELAHA